MKTKVPATRKYLILTGSLAGQTHTGHGCCYQAKPGSEYDPRFGEGIWIPSQQVRLRDDIDMKTGKPSAYTDLVAPYDKFNTEIFVGDILYAISKGKVVRVKVEKFGQTYRHRGSNWETRQLRTRDLDDGNKLVLVNDPYSTIKV